MDDGSEVFLDFAYPDVKLAIEGGQLRLARLPGRLAA
jgi:hypothetical protein